MEISQENLYLDIEAHRVNHVLLEWGFTPSMQAGTN